MDASGLVSNTKQFVGNLSLFFNKMLAFLLKQLKVSSAMGLRGEGGDGGPWVHVFLGAPPVNLENLIFV